MRGYVNTGDPSIPLIMGNLTHDKKNNKITVKDNNNETLFIAKTISKNDYEKKNILSKKISPYVEVRVIDKGEITSHYIKLKDIKIPTGSDLQLETPFHKNSKKSAIAFLHYISGKQGVNKLRDFHDIGPRTSKKVLATNDSGKQQFTYTQQQLSFDDCVTIVSTIESKKKEWLDSANTQNKPIKEKIYVSDNKKVIVEIYPSNRNNVHKLGRIDIKLEYSSGGTLKKVFNTYNYETERLGAGLYLSSKVDKVRVDNEVKISSMIQKQHYEKSDSGDTTVKTNTSGYVVSKAIDIFEKVDAHGKTVQKVKLSQTLYVHNSLDNILKSKRMPDGAPLTDADRVNFTVDILRGLERIHEQKILHRDIKPTNIIIKYSKKLDRYVAKITDYDLSETMEPNKLVEPAGSPYFIAPEVFSEFHTNIFVELNPSSDLYSLGVTFTNKPGSWWEFIGNKATFNRHELDSLVKYNLHSDMEPPQNTLAWGYWKLTHTDPTERFNGSAKEAREYFERFQT